MVHPKSRNRSASQSTNIINPGTEIRQTVFPYFLEKDFRHQWLSDTVQFIQKFQKPGNQNTRRQHQDQPYCIQTETQQTILRPSPCIQKCQFQKVLRQMVRHQIYCCKINIPSSYMPRKYLPGHVSLSIVISVNPTLPEVFYDNPHPP